MTKHSWHDSHVVLSLKSLLKALYVTAGFFLFLFVIFHIASSLYVSSLGNKSSDLLKKGIAEDMSYLTKENKKMADDEEMVKYLLAADSTKLKEIILQEVKTHSIGSLSVTNKEGIVLSRTQNLGVQGDNVFLTFPEGRVVRNGQSVENISQSIVDPSQARMTSGQPIVRGGQMIGAIFASQLLDDKYAVKFRDTYLPAGDEILFYNKQFGIYGDSMSDPETRKLVDSYFNSSSEWIKDGISGKTVSFKNDTYYLVQNIVFPGLEGSTAGALILVPRKYISDNINLAIALITLAIFLFLALKHYKDSTGEEHSWRYFLLLLGAAFPVVLISFFVLHIQNNGYLRLKNIPYILYNSTMRMQPEWGIYEKDFEQKFSVVVDTGDEAINAVQFEINFDPQAVVVKSLDTDSSACSYIIENTVSEKDGTAKLSCIILNGGEGKRSVRIADIVVVPYNTGTFNLSFNKEETKVLANDGLGTNVLRMSQGGSYRVDNFDPSLSSDISSTTDNPSKFRSFIVFSPTHPNQSRWYNSDVARFVWRGKPDAVYSYEFDTNPDTIPSKTHTVRGTSAEVPIPGDGIFYFHLSLASGGPVAHYKVQSDQTPPLILSMNLSSEKVFAGDVARFSFEGQDTASGIQQNYYVDLGSHLFLPIGSQLFVPFLLPGDQKIVLRVYDNAGNYSEKSKIIHVESPQ